MSYRNPKISQQDPLAFTKGFQAAFGQTMSAFKQVTDEIKKQKEKDDLLQAELLKYQNIGSLEGTSKKVNDAIQTSVESLINPMAFSFMKPVARQRYLQEVADIKTGLGLLTKFMAIPPSELSNRSMKNNKDLHAILHQLSSEERAKDVVISGDPDSLDVMFTYTNPESGRVSKVSARDMNKYANTYVSVKGDLDVLDKVSTSVAAVFNPVVNAYASSDKYIDKNPREELFNQESTDATIRGYLTDEMRATIFEEELAEQTNYQDFDPSNQVHMNLTFDYFKNEVYNKVRDVDNIKTKDTETGPPEQTEKTFLETYRPFVQNLLKKANTLSGGKASRKSQQEYIAKELNVLLGGNFKVTADGNNGMTTLTGANVSFDDTVDSKTTFALRNENSILRMLVKFKGPKEGSKRTEILNSLNL
jgi:hypothetical protein